MKEKFYITTSITYTSQKPHIGNTYEAVMADAIARYKRMCDYDVFFLTGTDEHGLKIQNAAEKRGITPQQYVDGVCAQLKEIWALFGVSYDKFIRTTDNYHIKAVQKIFRKLYEQGDIYKGTYEGWYCTPDEAFWTPTQVVDGKCPECGREVVKAHEEAYFLKLSKYQDWLIDYIETHPGFIIPESRKNEMLNNFLRPGLQDLCVSRTTLKWGIPVNFDEKHVVYVWMDALSNYITALGYTPDAKSEMFDKYWPADLHVIGKDIIRFHTIYWPIILHALDLPLPKQVIGHPWLLSGADKMSKSRGNVLYGDDLVSIFGRDTIRYYLLGEMGYADDGTISYEDIIKTSNAELANILGNLINRTAAMIKQYFDSTIPKSDVTEECDGEFFASVSGFEAKAKESYDAYKLSDAVKAVSELFKSCNKYIDITTPWVLAREAQNKARLGTVMHNLVRGILIGAQLLIPLMPDSAAKIFGIFGVKTPEVFTDDITFAGNVIGEVPILFARIDEKKKLAEIEKYFEDKHKEEAPEKKDEITIDDFAKVKLVTGEILECEPVPKSDKLLKLIVNIGTQKRQVVSGIAKFYQPQQLIGKKIILVSNLKAIKLRDVESHGMILCSGEDNVRIVSIDSDVPNGTEIR